MKLYHFTYKTTNIVNNKIYFGIHSTNNLEDGYIGSGRVFRLAIAKYGKASFVREILEFFDTREEASLAESVLITEEHINSPDCYNVSFGGENSLFRHSEATKAKISEKTKGSLNPRFGHRWSSEDKEKLAGFKGKKHSEVTKAKISKLHKGSKKSEETKAKISASNKGVSRGLGKKHSEETKSKMSKSKTGKANYRFDDRPVEATCIETGKKIKFSSKSEAGKYFRVKSSNISKACDGVYSKSVNHTWRYI
ncbi:putative GIY-YIG family Seg-like homing endonuclease [Acinetobacter phage Ac42]|uniref:homing endonuclease n=1 Tax=Acinetobacter phage Ac42 TaxID=762660 RepID=UPI0001EBCD7D|nr:homing endonuclease [Acinetobacter phage Ac42]ADI96404.1 putative GIY-YIG family Seg-like homing endonuclease [Acinetobacter phage Ac42]